MSGEGKESSAASGCGCLILLGLGVCLVWAAWQSAFECLLADNFDYVIKECAMSHLHKPSCNTERDILEVDEITDNSYTDKQAKRWESRLVIYRFRKRPTSGPVGADILRDTAVL